MARHAGSDTEEGRSLLPRSLRPSDDYGSYVNSALTLWVQSKRSIERSIRSPGDQRKLAEVVYEQQATAEMLDYGCMIHRRFAQRATTMAASTEQVLAAQQDLIRLDAAMGEVGRFGEGARLAGVCMGDAGRGPATRRCIPRTRRPSGRGAQPGGHESATLGHCAGCRFGCRGCAFAGERGARSQQNQSRWCLLISMATRLGRPRAAVPQPLRSACARPSVFAKLHAIDRSAAWRLRAPRLLQARAPKAPGRARNSRSAPSSRTGPAPSLG